MAPPSFPTLSGQSWSVHKRPNFSTIVASHPSGREVRYANFLYPRWQFELTYDGLTNAGSGPFASGLGVDSLQTLIGFQLQMQGRYSTFLYTDPTDNTVVAQPLSQGDGVSAVFPFARSLGGFLEPVGWVTSVANVYLNGVAQSGGWSLVSPNWLSFFSPPGVGIPISADFSYAFQCRFDDDMLDFEEFMSTLWQLGSLKFRSVAGYSPFYYGAVSQALAAGDNLDYALSSQAVTEGDDWGDLLSPYAATIDLGGLT
jgi:hypothetical protein